MHMYESSWKYPNKHLNFFFHLVVKILEVAEENIFTEYRTSFRFSPVYEIITCYSVFIFTCFTIFIVFATQKELQNLWDSNLYNSQILIMNKKGKFGTKWFSHRYHDLLIIMVTVHPFLMSVCLEEERKGRNKEKKVLSFWASVLK